MGQKNKQKQNSFVPQFLPKANTPETVYINRNVAQMSGWKREGNSANPFVSLRYVQDEYECFSSWSRIEMKSFWSFIERFSSITWQDVLNQAGKANKTGFAYTAMSLENYPKSDFKNQLDPTITLFELRISEKSRLHCFRDGSVCYVCWLDKSHRICS